MTLVKVEMLHKVRIMQGFMKKYVSSNNTNFVIWIHNYKRILSLIQCVLTHAYNIQFIIKFIACDMKVLGADTK